MMPTNPQNGPQGCVDLMRRFLQNPKPLCMVPSSRHLKTRTIESTHLYPGQVSIYFCAHPKIHHPHCLDPELQSHPTDAQQRVGYQVTQLLLRPLVRHPVSIVHMLSNHFITD